MSSADLERNVALCTRINAEHTDASSALQAPADAVAHPFYSDIPAEWGRRWPGEEIWVARKA